MFHRGGGVCTVCHSGPNSDYPQCASCAQTTRQVSHPVRRIVPISLYEVSDQYWTILRGYKDDPMRAVRTTFTTVLAATISQFLSQHWNCIARTMGGEPDAVTEVPSTNPTTRPEGHPLVRVISMIARLRDLYRPLLVRGSADIGHNSANDDGYRATERLTGRSVLLVEDTFTSGARIQSAASRLFLAGAESVGVLVAGRVMSPTYNENCERIWSYARGKTFDFSLCGVCSNEHMG